MMKRLTVLILATLVATALPAGAYDKMPGKGKTVKPARATWNTGFFHAGLIEQGLKDLGFKVKKTKDLPNPIFYQSLALGDLDYWPNGWFPLHNNQLPKNFADKAETVGYVVKAGGLQGYLASKDAVEKFGIKSLDDFKRDEVKKAFDGNKDGKADLVACPPGWGCEKVITHHMKEYDLKKHVNPIKATYSASMAEALARHKNGEPVLFYTWAPNWTIFKFKPGQDVMWINVPEIKPLVGAQDTAVAQMTVKGIEGAVSDPVKLGFVVNDIRIVANKKFMEKNPAAKKFFELVEVPLGDINEQNTRMQEGEDSAKDIQRHIEEWIDKNKEKWNMWLEEARKAA